MSNPYSPQFSPHERGTWCRLTRRWLRSYAGLTTGELALMTGLSATTITMMSSRHKSQEWLCELLGALVAGWRPRRLWSRAPLDDIRDEVQAYIWSPGHSLDTYERLLPVSLPRWADAIYEGTADNVPPRLAVMAEALLAGAVPCGIPFETWEP